MSFYAKALVALFATGLSVLSGVLTDGVITPTEWANVAIAVVMAAAVFTAPNVPGAEYTKGILAAVLAGLALVHNLIAEGGWPLPTSAWLQVGVAALGALGVLFVPNRQGATVQV